MTDPNREVETATAADLQTIVELQRKFSNQLGFIPRPAIEQHLALAHVLKAKENAYTVGYILHRRMAKQTFVHQIAQTAVFFDAQRRKHALALIQAIEQSTEAEVLQAWCAADIEANSFWEAAGFLKLGYRRGKNARQRDLILWRKPLSPAGWTRLRELPPVAGKTNQFDPSTDFVWNEALQTETQTPLPPSLIVAQPIY